MMPSSNSNVASSATLVLFLVHHLSGICVAPRQETALLSKYIVEGNASGKACHDPSIFLSVIWDGRRAGINHLQKPNNQILTESILPKKPC
jgi:hypothetical protein